MSGKINTAVIGVGAFGQNHARIVSQLENVHLTGIVDADESRGKEIAGKFNTVYYDSYEKIADQVQAAVIITPTSLHYEVGSFFLSKGKNVFIEKPIASNSPDAEKLVDLAAEKNLILKVGHVERFNPAYMSLRNMIAKPLFIEARRTSPFPERIKDTDVVMDMMIHDIDLVLDLARAEAAEIKSFGMKVLSERIDIAQAMIEFDNGTVANITTSRVSPNKFRKLRVFEKDKYYSMDLLNKTSYIADVVSLNGKKTINTIKQDIAVTDSLKMELEDFFKAVNGEASIGVNGEDAAKALKLAERIVSGLRCP